MRSIILAALVALFLPTIAQATKPLDIYTQARVDQAMVMDNQFGAGQGYMYQTFGAALAVYGRPDKDKLSAFVSASALEANGNFGFRGTGELNWAPRPTEVPGWFHLTVGVNHLPALEVANAYQIQHLIQFGDLDESAPSFFQIPTTWTVDASLGVTTEIPLGGLTEKLDWLGIFASPSFGVTASEYHQKMGIYTIHILGGLRVSN